MQQTLSIHKNPDVMIFAIQNLSSDERIKSTNHHVRGNPETLAWAIHPREFQIDDKGNATNR
jgi:hypothetical protein